MQGLGFRVSGSGFWIQDLGYLGCRVVVEGPSHARP